MSEKRRGLGRGLGALIPPAPSPAQDASDRPVDVFFPERKDGEEDAPSSAEAKAGDGNGSGRGSRGSTKSRTGVPSLGSLGGISSTPAVLAEPRTETTVGTDLDGPASPAAETVADGLVPVPGARFAEVPVTSITPNPKQPRQVFDEEELSELVHSVREIGVLQPIVVRP